MVKQYWNKIYKEILRIYKFSIPKSPEMMLLGLNLESITYNDRISFWYLLTATRLQYAKLWRQKQTPTIKDWIYSVRQIIEMDKLTRKVRARVRSIRKMLGKGKKLYGN